MKPDNFEVCAFVLDVAHLTIYSPDGTSITIKQGDPRVALIVKKVQPFVAAGQTCVIDLSLYDENALHNYYGEAEKQFGGVIRFFRVARNAVKKLFGAKEAEIMQPCVGGVIPTDHTAAINEVMANAIPSTSREFKVPSDVESEQVTVVALVGDTVVPDADALKGQIKHAIEHNSIVGVQRLIERVAVVAKERGHSVEDLMKFMKLGDLPVTDNGDIMVFKALNRKSFGDEYDKRFVWADIHSGNVPQRLGSEVSMPVELVDPNRSQDCSHGLHIASRSYLGSFVGNVCVVVLVRPEDVIAVPRYSHTKMRVMRYHIVAELTNDQYTKLKQNKTFADDEEGKQLIGRIMSGDHIGVTNQVRVTKPYGHGIEIVELENQEETESKPKKVRAVSSVEVSNDDGKIKAPVVSAKEVIEKGNQLKKGGQAAQAAELYKAYQAAKGSAQVAAAKDLLEFKRKAKKGWPVLLNKSADFSDELKKVIEG